MRHNLRGKGTNSCIIRIKVTFFTHARTIQNAEPCHSLLRKGSRWVSQQNSNNGKIQSVRGTMGRGKSGSEAFLLSFPFPSSPARFLFPSLQSSLRYKEASGEPSSKRLPTFYSHVIYGWQGPTVSIHCLFVFFFIFAILIRQWSKSLTKCAFQLLSYFYSPVNDTFLV